MWNDDLNAKIVEFLANSDLRLLTFFTDYSDSVNKLKIQAKNEVPVNLTDKFFYLIKSYCSQEIDDQESFQKYVQYGIFNGRPLASLLKLTSGLYAPLFFGNQTWPDSIHSKTTTITQNVLKKIFQMMTFVVLCV